MTKQFGPCEEDGSCDIPQGEGSGFDAGFGAGVGPHEGHGRGRGRRGGRLRAQAGAGGFGFGPGGLGPGGFGPGGGFNPAAFVTGGFGPGAPGFGPGFGFGFGPGGGGGRGGPRGHRRGGRGRRGDVRAAILALLAERPMHGYEMIQEIGERSKGLWRPSPGSVYPTLQLLVDEGLTVATESEGSKKLFDLTDEGREAAAKLATPPWEEIADGVDPGHVNLRAAVGQLMGAVAQVAITATPEQQERITEVVNNARREIYGILGETE